MGSFISKKPEFIDVTIDSSYDYSGDGYFVYRLIGLDLTTFAALPYQHSNFITLRDKLKRGMVRRCVILYNRKYQHNFYDHNEYVPELVDVLPVPPISITAQIDGFAPYQHNRSEIILTNRPFKLPGDKKCVRLWIETDRVKALESYVGTNLNLTMTYIGGNNYQVTEINCSSKTD
jgi:hypothetical protein